MIKLLEIYPTVISSSTSKSKLDSHKLLHIMDEPREKPVDRSSTPSVKMGVYYDETLAEPPIDKTLHRDLKARQISMIAVRIISPVIVILFTNTQKLGGAIGTGLIIVSL